MSKKIQRRVQNAMKLFGFTQKPTRNELRSKYREFSLKHHPDRGGSEGNFKKVNWANDVLQRHGDLDVASAEEAEVARPGGLSQPPPTSASPAGIGETPRSQSAIEGSSSPLPIGGNSSPLLIGTEGSGVAGYDASAMLGGSGSGQPWAADAQHREGPEPPPMAQILGDADDESREPFQQPGTGKKKRQKAEQPTDWGGFLGKLGHGIGGLGQATGNQTLSSIGGGMQSVSQIMSAVNMLSGTGGSEEGSADHASIITNLLGAAAGGGQGSTAPSTQGADMGGDLQKALEKLTEVMTLLIEKMGGLATPGTGGTQMPHGGSLGSSTGGDGIDMKQIVQIVELIMTMMRMLAVAAV